MKRRAMLVTVVSLCWAATAAWVKAEDAEIVIDDKPVSQWVTQLRSGNRGLQMRAAQALAKVSTNDMPKLVPQLLPLLKSERENDRFVAAQTLGNYGPVAGAAVSDLVPLLKGTQYERNRAAAAKALGMILVDAQPSEDVDKVAKALAEKFNEDYDQYSDVRRESVRAIGMIGPAAKSVIPKLSRGLTDFVLYSGEHQMVRQQSAWACGRMGPLAVEHVDRLISMLNAEGSAIPEIVEALGRIGPVNDNVVQNIMNVAESRDRSIRGQIETYVALERFGPKAAPAVPLLVRFLREKGLAAPLTIQIVKTLKAVGPASGEAVPVLKEFMGAKPGYFEPWPPMRYIKPDELVELKKCCAEAMEAITGKK